MRLLKWVFLSMAGLGLVTQAWSRPVDLSAPQGGVGATDLQGYLEIWSEVDGVGLDLGKGSYLPLRFKFSSNPTVNGILGTGFYCPMFEAKNILIREQMMRAFLPCGKGLYLRRDNTDPTKFQTMDREWTGSLYGDNGENFVLWRDDGWKLLYHKGRLASLVNDENHTFTWDYDGRGLPTEVSEDGHALITVEPNEAGQVAAFVSNSKRYEVGYAERPITQMLLGQSAIKELDQVLSSFKYPDGKTETFKFALTPDRIPTVTFTDKDNKTTLYSWDVATNHIVTEKGLEGNWTYRVEAASQDFGVPAISRANDKGKTEGLVIDTKLGTYTATATDGSTTVTHIFETPGPLYYKVKSVETTTHGVTATVYKASYDEAGKLIRKIDEKGFITTFDYDAEGHEIGHHVSLSSDPAFLASLAAKEKALLKELNQANKSDQTSVLQDLMIFYVSQAMDFDKAAGLLKLMTDREQIYNLKLDLAVANPNLPKDQREQRLAQLIQDFPDKKNYTENFVEKKEMQ